MSVHLSTKFRHQVTWNGYAADLMKSGLQKYIRRGQTDKALYCAGELDLFKEAQDEEKGEGVRTNFLHRLMVIYMEDVENVSLFPIIYHSMKELFTERTKPDRNKQKEEHQISEVVRLLSTSQKARVCSHIRAVFHPAYKAIHASYPSIHHLWTFIEKNNATTLADYCTLFQTYLQEKNILAVYYAIQIDRSTEKLGAPLFRSKSPVWFIFHELVKKNEQVKLFVEWYKEHLGTVKEAFLCWLFPLLHVLDIIPKGEVPAVQGGNWDRNRAGEKIEIEDYVEDKHTSKGRGKGLVEFALRGSLVENQAGFVNPLWKQFYEDGKRMEDGVPILGEAPAAQKPLAQKPLAQKPAVQKARRPPIVEEKRSESSTAGGASIDTAVEVAPTEVASTTGITEVDVTSVVASTAGVTEVAVTSLVAPSGGLEVAGKASFAVAPSGGLEPRQEVKDRNKLEIAISTMNDNFVFIDNLYRSRMTLLDILEERGYEVAKYRAFSPAEATAAAAAFPSLSFKVSKRDDATKVCDVRYAAITRQKLEEFFKDVPDENSENTEVIVMMPGPVGDAHHMTALKQYMLGKEQPGPNGEKIRRKLRVSFFSMYMLVVNPLKHTLVPKHEIVPEEKHKDLMASLYATSKSKFPEIKFHVDPIARCIGAVPGDIVKITRASASSGESIIYRVCAP